MSPVTTTRIRRAPARGSRRGFNIVEMLIALAITAVLLTATMVALDASFKAYQSTTEVASTHTISRMTIHRMQALIRMGQDFGPFPNDPTITTIESDFIEFATPDDPPQVMALEYDINDEALYIVLDPGPDETRYVLLEGVIPQYDPPTSTAEDDRIMPFTLEYEQGRHLYRATIDLTVVPDDNMSVELDGNNVDVLRLVASAMPRTAAFQ